MARILVINPNSSEATTAMMVRIARAAMPPAWEVTGATGVGTPMMIVDAPQLAASAPGVVDSWHRHGEACDGVIIGAFGDPGLDLVRAATAIPVLGIGEASMREAAQGGRRFGVATTTPGLAGPIAGLAAKNGHADLYTGVRLTAGEPLRLAADPPAMEEELARATRLCIEEDGAQAVIIGGGPLGQAALQLAPRFSQPVIAPIEAAARAMVARLRS